MSKRSSATRSGQRQKQKSFELVLPEVPSNAEDTSVATSEPEIEATSSPSESSDSSEVATPAEQQDTKAATVAVEEPVAKPKPVAKQQQPAASTAKKKSASERMKARRQAILKAQQQHGTAMITAEHFAYVKRDLALIATLAIIFFTTIIVLYFVIL